MTTATKSRTNRYAATCEDCGQNVPAGTGQLVKAADGWIVRCADTATCASAQNSPATAVGRAMTREAMPAADPGESGHYTGAEETALAAVGIHDLFDPRNGEVLLAAGLGDGLPEVAQARETQARPARRKTGGRRKACVTGGNCSSVSGTHCGGHDCDAN